MHNKDDTTPRIEWRNGQPFSTTFQDVYFSTDNGIDETDYVFLQGNHLATRFIENHHPGFHIAETGFGTGLNFLCAAKLWLETAPQEATLHFTSTEKYPLSLQEITAALDFWPSLQPLAAPLIAEYEHLTQYAKSIFLYDHRVQLSILTGDATARLSQSQHLIDAWFLDGFAPAKNPDMWQEKLFQEMKRLSKANSTFATFTSAGNVRRGLLNAGFKVNKCAGYGKKREMLTGYFLGHQYAG